MQEGTGGPAVAKYRELERFQFGNSGLRHCFATVLSREAVRRLTFAGTACLPNSADERWHQDFSMLANF